MWQSARLVVASTIVIICSACDTRERPATDVPANQPASTPPAVEELPADGAFVGRAWVGTSGGPERGSVLVFLPDRTLVSDPCPGALRITEWGVVDGRIRWTEREGAIPIEAEVSLPAGNDLRLSIVGRDQETYVAASPPFACPEAPGG